MKDIKVLHLFNQYLPQTENWCHNLIANTPNTQVYIGAREYLKNNFYHSRFQYAEHPLGALDAYNSQLSKSNPLDWRRKLALKILKTVIGDPRKIIGDFAQAQEIDLIHAHFADVGWYFRKIPQRLKKPFVLSFYGWDYESLPFMQPEYLKYYQKLFKIVDVFICEGTHGGQILATMDCPESKIKIVPLGVESRKIPIIQRSKKPGELHLLQIASFNEKKGHIYTVKAFARALASCPNMSLSLVGGEGQKGIKKDVLDFIQTQQLEKKIRVYDAINYDQLYPFLADYQVFIHPSCYAANRDCEGGAPIVLLDAQATGMPVIATRHCDIPMEVLHEKTGLLAEEKNIEELTQHIQTFYAMDESAYQVYCQNARTHVLDNFDSKENAKKLKVIYDALG